MSFQSLAVCNCPACAGAPLEAQHSGDGLGGLAGAKPVWSLDQSVANLTRWDARWAPGPVPYTFYNSTPAHLAGHPDWQGFVSFSPAQREATRLVLELIGDVANLQFVERPDDGTMPSGANPRVTFSTSLSTAQHYTAYAGTKFAQNFELGDAHRITSAEMMFNAHRWNGGMEPGERPFYVLIHETLHSLGLPHPGAYNNNGQETITYATHAAYAQDSHQFTAMSYFSASATGSKHIGFLQTPMLHDVAALQALYGANTATRAGDTVYGYGSTAGRSVFDFAQNPAPIFTIWDGGGIDRLDLSLTAFAANVDLNAGAFSDAFQMTNNISIAFGATIENATTGSGDDRIVGNGADNVLRAGAGNDDIGARGGNDQLFGGDGDDALGGGEGDDVVDGGSGRDLIFGEGGRDWLNGLDGDDRIFAGDGDDLMGGQDGNDVINGDGGRDTLYGDAGADWLNGDAGDDRIHGQDGDDLMGGQDGDDVIVGGAGRDTLFGDDGNDWLNGELDGDRIYGQGGDDLMGGQEGDDLLDGGAGRDTLYGDDGADTIVGGAGGDILFGQGGADVFFFGALFDSRAGEVDRVVDFNAAAGDRIDLSAMDADLAADGDQAFSLTGAFSGRSGEAVLSFDGTFTTLTLDVNGDRLEDFRLLIDGQVDGSTGFLF